MIKKFELIQKFLVLFITILFFITGCGSKSETNSKKIYIAAASDLHDAFTELGKNYKEDTGNEVVFNFGSTGLLAEQVKQGAKIDIFAAADKRYIDDLEKEGLIVSDTIKMYGIGRIVLWSKEKNVSGLEDLLSPKISKIAIANPNHAPYGIAAKQVLVNSGLWDKIQPKLVFGENVKGTQQLAETGNADVAIVALSLAVGSNGKYKLISSELHKSLKQFMAVIKSSKQKERAKDFVNFVVSAEGRTIMKKYGFILP
ncbi:MAG: molybdate ABC transporter substrate-binding protein [Actinobacteria bacterium]|nr:molybdate ABC transporter substrate-binding protein [Actinomycetota bacterium]